MYVWALPKDLTVRPRQPNTFGTCRVSKRRVSSYRESRAHPRVTLPDKEMVGSKTRGSCWVTMMIMMSQLERKRKEGSIGQSRRSFGHEDFQEEETIEYVCV